MASMTVLHTYIYTYITCFIDCFKTYDTTIQNQEIDSKNQKTRDSSIIRIYIYMWSGSFYLMWQESKGTEDPLPRSKVASQDLTTIRLSWSHFPTLGGAYEKLSRLCWFHLVPPPHLVLISFFGSKTIYLYTYIFHHIPGNLPTGQYYFSSS